MKTILILREAAACGDIPDETAQQVVDMVELLKRAHDKLQDYCADANGDMNDALAMAIRDKLGAL